MRKQRIHFFIFYREIESDAYGRVELKERPVARRSLIQGSGRWAKSQICQDEGIFMGEQYCRRVRLKHQECLIERYCPEDPPTHNRFSRLLLPYQKRTEELRYLKYFQSSLSTSLNTSFSAHLSVLTDIRVCFFHRIFVVILERTRVCFQSFF